MIFKENVALSREWSSNPYKNISLEQRLKNNKSIDLRENYVMIDYENDYSRIIPIDTNKIFK